MSPWLEQKYYLEDLDHLVKVATDPVPLNILPVQLIIFCPKFTRVGHSHLD